MACLCPQSSGDLLHVRVDQTLSSNFTTPGIDTSDLGAYLKMHGADTVPGVRAAESTEIFPNFCNKKNDMHFYNTRPKQ